MKELIAKIRGSKPEQKCQMTAEVYGQITQALEDLSNKLDEVGLNLNVSVFDKTFDQIEKVLSELEGKFELLKILPKLKERFEKNRHRHKKITWEQVEKRLFEADAKKIWSLSWMEKTGGEPDVIAFSKKEGVTFQDRSPEIPIGRRNFCYDKEGEDQFRGERPIGLCSGNAIDMAAHVGLELLDEKQYRRAQRIEQMDLHSSTWLKTPIEIRNGGIAIDARRHSDGFGLFFREAMPYYCGDNMGWRGQIKI